MSGNWQTGRWHSAAKLNQQLEQALALQTQTQTQTPPTQDNPTPKGPKL